MAFGAANTQAGHGARPAVAAVIDAGRLRQKLGHGRRLARFDGGLRQDGDGSSDPLDRLS